MREFKKVTPEGTRDLLFEQCVLRRDLENTFVQLFRQRGFNEVLTPCIEFLDVFSQEISGISLETMYKLLDNHGRILVLRPDSTIPIARLVSSKLNEAQLPIRLYYTQDVFRLNQSMKGKSNQIVQTGVELIGAKGLRSDLELLVTAIEALDCSGAPDYRLEIGHVGFFNALCSGFSKDNQEEIRKLIDSKNYTGLNKLLDEFEDTSSVNILRLIPRLFGGKEVLEQALSICDNSRAIEELNYLISIYTNLEKLGQSEKVVIDLGLVSKFDYYTGIIFRGFITGSGDTVLQGGRYDHLIENFGRSMPAAGFAIEIDSLISTMLLQGNNLDKSVPDILIHGDKGYEMKALLYAKDLMKNGLVCENSIFDSKDKAKSYAKEKGINRVVFVSEIIEEFGGE